MCDQCGFNRAMHLRGYEGSLCCRCYVLQGNSPADWHPLCMITYRALDRMKCGG